MNSASIGRMPSSTTSSSAAVGAASVVGRHGECRRHRDQHVDHAGGDHAADQGARERAVRVDRLLRDVRGVLEAGHREERERDTGEDRQRRAGAALGLELGQRRRSPRCPRRCTRSPMIITITRPAISTKAISMLMTTDSVMPMKLTMLSTSDEHQGDQQGRRAVPERGEVRREAIRQCAGGREARGQEGDGDQERQRLVAERLVDVERGAGRLGVLRDQLGVRRTGDRRDRDADREGDPERASDGRGDQADQDVDPGAEHVAEGVEEELPAR